MVAASQGSASHPGGSPGHSTTAGGWHCQWAEGEEEEEEKEEEKEEEEEEKEEEEEGEEREHPASLMWYGLASSGIFSMDRLLFF